MTNCEMCLAPLPAGDPGEVVTVDGSPVHVGECCFWSLMSD